MVVVVVVQEEVVVVDLEEVVVTMDMLMECPGFLVPLYQQTNSWMNSIHYVTPTISTV